jgi:prefoldin beta subunit
MNIQEMLAQYQHLQGVLQGLVQQKQQMDLAIAQLKEAKEWISISKDDVVEINVGMVTVKVDKEEAIKKIDNQIEILEIKAKGLSNQIQNLQKQLEALATQIQSLIQKQAPQREVRQQGDKE